MFEVFESQSPRILIVDDEPEIREVLFDLLKDGYECETASSAEEAIALIRRKDFTLIVSDIMMGGMSGLEMIPHVFKISPDTVVMMISGAQTIESAIKALRAGAFDYIMKPFDLTQVEAAVSRAIEHYELRVIKRKYEYHLEELVAQRTAELDNALETVEESYRSTLKALAQALETRDTETHGHSERVVTFSLRLGRELGLDKEMLNSLEFGSLLHDIGKIGVPDAILRKPAKLTEEEWAKMRMHPMYGQNILRDLPFLEGAAKVVGQHHEKWDGSGYPLGLKGEDIDLNARIFAVADAFDAMISDRVYRVGRPYKDASDELDRCAGSHFDPNVVEAFHRVPQEDWEELKRLSMIRKKEKFSPQTLVAEMIASRINAIAMH
jgi:response regulator RpfG family c-di-GMP phosphodiesterase